MLKNTQIDLLIKTLVLSTKQTCSPPALEAQAAMRNMVKQGEGFDKEDAQGKDEVAGAEGKRENKN